MDEHREELATLESIDSGAVYTLALKTHVGMSIDTFRYFAGWCDKIQVRFNSHCRNQQFRLYVKILYTIKGFWSRDISYSICEICIHTVHDVLLKWWNVNHNKTFSERFWDTSLDDGWWIASHDKSFERWIFIIKENPSEHFRVWLFQSTTHDPART